MLIVLSNIQNPEDEIPPYFAKKKKELGRHRCLEVHNSCGTVQNTRVREQEVRGVNTVGRRVRAGLGKIRAFNYGWRPLQLH